jgi:hypothetical protein
VVRALTARPRTHEMWPVKVSLRPSGAPAEHLARSHTCKAPPSEGQAQPHEDEHRRESTRGGRRFGVFPAKGSYRPCKSLHAKASVREKNSTKGCQISKTPPNRFPS